MESICATGIRVSEVKYLTVEAARCGRAEVALKGKIRTILLPAKLCRKLLKYAKKQKIAHGEIFLTTGGKGMDRRQIWSAMKRLCRKAGVAPSKVFPHNLRHLFATAYYRVYRSIVKLADMLGHSSIETTRIYLVESSAEHQRQLDRLGPDHIGQNPYSVPPLAAERDENHDTIEKRALETQAKRQTRRKKAHKSTISKNRVFETGFFARRSSPPIDF